MTAFMSGSVTKFMTLSMNVQQSTKTVLVVALCAVLLPVVGCRPTAGDKTDAATMTARELNVALNRRATSTLATHTADDAAFGVAQAFVTLNDEGTGQLFIRVDDEAPRALADADATPVLDPETPPQVVVDESGIIHVAYAASADVARRWETMAVRYTQSRDGGKTWSSPVSAGASSFDGYRNDHELHVTRTGLILVGWLDSTVGDQDSGAIHFVVSGSRDGGETWSPTAVVDENPSCECCRVALTSTSDGKVFAAWRKIFPNSERDMAIASSGDDGLTWSAPERVYQDGWVVGHCPDAGPSLLADAADALHVAWWTGKEGAAGVKYARTPAGGGAFGAPVVLKTGAVSRASHVQLAIAQSDTPGKSQVAVVWDDGMLEAPRVAIARSSNAGESFGEIEYLSDATASAHYPTAAVASDGALVVSWHRYGQGEAMQRAHDERAGPWTAPSPSSEGPAITVQRVPFGASE